ncbi:phosphodiester glycosidase family protein [Mariniluteicoccus flavus]
MRDSGVPASPNAAPGRIMLADTTRPVASGIDLRSFEWVDSQGFMRGDLMTVDLAGGQITPDYLFPGQIAKAEPLSAMATRARAVAAVNGDYFDINNSNAPLGAVKQNGRDLKGGNPGFTPNAVGVSMGNLGRLTSMFLEGTITTPTGTIPLGGLNQNAIPADGVGAYTELWGAYTRTAATQGATKVVEVVAKDGLVTAVNAAAGEGQLAAGEVAYVGRNAGADRLAAVRVGDRITMDYRLKADGDPLRMALSTIMVVLKDGNVLPQGDKALHPRTAIGFDATGSKMFLLTVDGRMAKSRGMTYEEIGGFLKEVGAVNGANLDGGGSSTMLAREAGEDDLDIENQPSDGSERHVPNGIGLFAKPGSGSAHGLRFITESDEENPELWKVFPGLTRELEALGFDETYAPVGVKPAYAMAAADGTIDAAGTVRPSHPGEVAVDANVATVRATRTLTVLGDLRRIRSTVDKVTIVDPAEAQRFQIMGADANGFEALIEPGDVTLDYDPALVTITPGKQGDFSVKAKEGAKGSVVVRATVKGVTTHVPVAVGSVSTVLANFDDVASWRFTNARAAGAVAPTTGHDGGPAIKMDFDFTLSTATRVGYARPPKPITITQGQPLALGMWVKGDAQNEWTSFGITDGAGKAMSLYGPYVDWTGWRYVEVPVPQTLQGPITLQFLAAIETKAARSYRGTISFDDVTVKTAPEVKVPASPRVEDPVVRQHTALGAGGKQWRFAVMSDAQFTAKDQSLVPAARRTMQEIVANRPDFVVINGDLVDTGYPDDFALAKKVIDEELTAKGVTWHYVPGNHEIYGPGNVSNFKGVFGETHKTFDHNGTRFVLLDSSTSILRTGGFDQIQMVKDALEGAKADPAINGVALAWHHPPRDPSPLKNSQMGDRVEAEMVERWLSDFRAQTGKGALFIGSHVGSFSANTVNAVPYVINGNSGKNPSTVPADGGFSGWSLVGIDPDAPRVKAPDLFRQDPSSPAHRAWVGVEMRAHVDELKAFAEKAELTRGDTTKVDVDVTQWGRTFPLDHPVSAAWSGTGVFLGDAARAPKDAVIAFDPEAKVATGLRGGTAELVVKVNDKEQRIAFTVKEGPLGAPTSDRFCGLRDSGCGQHFEKGSIYDSASTDPHIVRGAIKDHWASLGWENGQLGYPVNDEFCGLRDGGCWQQFQGGAIYASTAATFANWGAIREEYARQGFENGRLGYPTSGEFCGLRDGGCAQRFEHGLIYWAPATGAHTVLGAIGTAYASVGWERSQLGYATSNEFCGLTDGGCVQRFQGGLAYSSPAGGAHVVWGAINQRYAELGWEKSPIGYPTSGEICGLKDGGCVQFFERGTLYWSPQTGAWPVFGAIRDHYGRLGWENGRLGYPVRGEQCGPVGSAWECTQRFQGGQIVWNSERGFRG